MWNLLLELGATVTRAHYPLHPQFLEMADRAGVLVWDQIPFYRVAVENIRLKTVREKGLSLLERMIRRDQNHPAVFTWSIANELASRPDSYQLSYINAAAALAKRLDPTRLRAMDIAGYPSVAPLESYNRLDALGINSYFGWYPGPSGQVLDYAGLNPYLDQLHDYYPDKALFITEFGAEANRHGPIDEKGTYEYQSEFMQTHLSTYNTKPWLNGAIAWLLQDFRVRPDWDGGNPKPNPPMNQKGLVDEKGNKKPAFEETRRMFRDLTAVR
jgi:beta-glucuronidase